MRNRKMKMFKFAIPLSVLTLLIIAALSLLQDPDYTYTDPNYIKIKDNISLFGLEDKTVISVNNNEKLMIDGRMTSVQYSTDRSKASVFIGQGGALWYVAGSDATKIADNVCNYMISASGGGVAYFTGCDYNNPDNQSASLYLYDFGRQSAEKIADNAYMGRFCLSPDGKIIGYATDYDANTCEYDGYIKQAGKDAVKLGKNTMCAAISDKAKYIYYTVYNPDSKAFSLYARKGGRDMELIPETVLSSYGGFRLLLNADCSQAVFSYGEQAYIVRNGGEKEKIADCRIHWLLAPRDTKTVSSYAEYGEATIYGVKYFANTNFIAGEDFRLLHMNKKYKTSKIMSERNYSLASDGKTVFFTDSQKRLCKSDASVSDAERTVISGEETLNHVCSENGSLVYFVNVKYELWCAKGSGKPYKIADRVPASNLVMASGSKKAYFVADYSYRDGILYYSDNGGEKVRVSEGADVLRVFATPTNIFYYSYYSLDTHTYDVYRSDVNETFTKFQENASDFYLW